MKLETIHMSIYWLYSLAKAQQFWGRVPLDYIDAVAQMMLNLSMSEWV